MSEQGHTAADVRHEAESLRSGFGCDREDVADMLDAHAASLEARERAPDDDAVREAFVKLKVAHLVLGNHELGIIESALRASEDRVAELRLELTRVQLIAHEHQESGNMGAKLLAKAEDRVAELREVRDSGEARVMEWIGLHNDLRAEVERLSAPPVVTCCTDGAVFQEICPRTGKYWCAECEREITIEHPAPASGEDAP